MNNNTKGIDNNNVIDNQNSVDAGNILNQKPQNANIYTQSNNVTETLGNNVTPTNSATETLGNIVTPTNNVTETLSDTVVSTTPLPDSSVQPATEVMEPAISNEVNSSQANKASDEEYVYTPPSKLRYVFLIIVFIIMMVMIFFLPNITEYVAIKKAEKNQVVEQFVDGRLVCSMKKSSTNLDMKYKSEFAYTDNKLDKLTITITTSGDQTLDYDELNKIYTNCTSLSSSAHNISGISISCDFAQSSVVEKQTFNYNLIDLEKVTSAYVEAGGIVPEYSAGEDIFKIEKNMFAQGYTCERVK